MLWKITLLGALSLERTGHPIITRFRSRKAAGLLAYLALHPGQHAREMLIGLFWPEDETAQGQLNLRVTLNSLRKQLEPPGVKAQSVLISTRTHVGLNVEAYTTDVSVLRQAIKNGDVATIESFPSLELLPGFYEDWSVTEAERLIVLLSQIPNSRTIAPKQVSQIPVVIEKLPQKGERVGMPAHLDRFFGREIERENLQKIFSSGVKNITIQGAGGSGKTRLAAMFAAQWDGDCVFVSLADTTDAERLLDEIAKICLTTSSPNNSPNNILNDLVEYLSSRTNPLLVLDNLEQLTGTTLVRVLGQLRQKLPDLHLLLTSRQRVRLAGERLFPLATLPLPQVNAPLEELATVPSMALFVDRAQAYRGDFQLTLRNAPPLAQLIQPLEGVPLAIELAASWIGLFTPTQILEQVQASLLSLKSRRERSETRGRHESLWAVASWSYNLLTPELQSLFCGLSLFRGGASGEAIQTVCQNPQPEDALVRLIERSLLRVDIETGRFSLPEALREFAAQQLPETQRQEAEWRHATYLGDLAWRLGRAPTKEKNQGFAQCDQEFGNFQIAFERSVALATREGLMNALRITGGLWSVWEPRGALREANHMLKLTLECVTNLPLVEDTESGPLLAEVWSGLGVIAMRHGDFEKSKECHQHTIAIHRRTGTPQNVASALINLGSTYSASGNYDEAELCLLESLTLHQDNNLPDIADIFLSLGNLYVRWSKPDKGASFLEKSRALQESINDKFSLPFTLVCQAFIPYLQGNYKEAIRFYREALIYCKETDNILSAATSISNISACLYLDGDTDFEHIIFIASISNTLREKNGIAPKAGDQKWHDAIQNVIRPAMGEEKYQESLERGRNADWKEVF
jgi:predicted ATPase/DNA-binding winged helix-turn-helix (wHTH) protein